MFSPGALERDSGSAGSRVLLPHKGHQRAPIPPTTHPISTILHACCAPPTCPLMHTLPLMHAPPYAHHPMRTQCCAPHALQFPTCHSMCAHPHGSKLDARTHTPREPLHTYTFPCTHPALQTPPSPVRPRAAPHMCHRSHPIGLISTFPCRILGTHLRA